MEWNNNFEEIKPPDCIAEWMGNIWIEIEPKIWKLKEVYIEIEK